MSFFAKIKQFFGVGTVSIKIAAPATFKTEDGLIKGTVTVVGKSDQVLEYIEVELQEKWESGRGDDKTEKEFKIGKVKLPGFEIKNGETKTIDFELAYTYEKSSNEELAGKGGVLGGLGKVAQFATNEKSAFSLIATADVKGATFDPNDILEIKRIK
jgi:hypothetical protein